MVLHATPLPPRGYQPLLLRTPAARIEALPGKHPARPGRRHRHRVSASTIWSSLRRRSFQSRWRSGAVRPADPQRQSRPSARIREVVRRSRPSTFAAIRRPRPQYRRGPGRGIGAAVSKRRSAATRSSPRKASAWVSPRFCSNLFPAWGAYTFLTRRVTAAQAERMMLDARIYSAEELLKMGVVDYVVPRGRGPAGCPAT